MFTLVEQKLRRAAPQDWFGVIKNAITGDGRDTDAQGKMMAASHVDLDRMDVGASDPANAPVDDGPPPMPMAGAYGGIFRERAIVREPDG